MPLETNGLLPVTPAHGVASLKSMVVAKGRVLRGTTAERYGHAA